MADEGTLNKIEFKKVNPGGIKQLIQQARKGIKIKPPSLVGIGKAFTKANLMNILSGAASFADIGIPDKDVADKLREEDKSEGWEMYRQQMLQDITTTGLLAGATKLIMGAGGVTGGGVVGSVALPLIATGYAFNKLDESVFQGEGKRFLREDVAPVFNAAKEGDALTSIPGDNTLGSSLQQNKIGSRDLVKYRTQESTEWTTDLDEDEEPEAEYKYAPSLTLGGV